MVCNAHGVARTMTLDVPRKPYIIVCLVPWYLEVGREFRSQTHGRPGAYVACCRRCTALSLNRLRFNVCMLAYDVKDLSVA